MFGKKKNAPNVEPATEQTGQVQDVPKEKVKKEKPAKKKKNGLSQVFRTSVFATILEDLRANEPFIHVQNGNTVYIALAFNTEDVGGMDKKSARKDEAKGSIIEKISAGRIKAYITDELMDEGLLVFIPEAMTLSEMDDFSILTTAKYELCAIDINGDIELLGQYVDYHSVCDIVMDDGHVDNILEGGDDIPYEDSAEGLADSVQSSVDAGLLGSSENVPFDGSLSDVDDGMMDDDVDDIEDIDDDVDSMDDIEPLDTMSEPKSEAFPGEGPSVDAVPYETSYPVEDVPLRTGANTAQGVPAEPAPEEETEIPAGWAYEAMVRKFYSDDLGLEATTEPFDAQFIQGNVFVPFDENRPEGWLNEQLNEMSRQANLDLAKLHEENLFLLRERYFKLISGQCDRIGKDLSIHDPGTQYGQWYQQIEQEKQISIQNLDGVVAKKKQELEADWKDRLQKVGMDAARAAQRTYRERYQQQHSEQIASLEDMVKASCIADFEDQKKEILERRRMEASTLLDLSITETLNEVSDMYLTFLEDEKLRYQEHKEQMKMFRDELLQEDIARTRVLDEELRQNDRADQVLAEQTAKIRAMTDDFNAKKHSLHQELANLRADNQARLAEAKQDAEDRVARAMAEKEKADERFNELMKNYESLESSIKQRYKNQIAEMKDELASSEIKCEHLMNNHSRNNRMSIFLMIAVAIAALFIGFVGGEFASSSRQVKMYAQQSYQKMMEESNLDAAEK